jgi:P27 family predicted phage terminase small subunit
MSRLVPKPPDWLDREGRKEWKRLADILDRVPDLMTEPDWYLVGILADGLSTYKQMTAIIRGQKTSDLKQHQVVRMRIEAKNTILECLRQLGMTPQSRRQMHGATPPKDADNPLGEYIFKLNNCLDT